MKNMKIYISTSKEPKNMHELPELARKIGVHFVKLGFDVVLSHTLTDGNTNSLHGDKLKLIQSEIKASQVFVLLYDEPNMQSGIELAFASQGKKLLFFVYKFEDKIEDFIKSFFFQKRIEMFSDQHVIHSIESKICPKEK